MSKITIVSLIVGFVVVAPSIVRAQESMQLRGVQNIRLNSSVRQVVPTVEPAPVVVVPEETSIKVETSSTGGATPIIKTEETKALISTAVTCVKSVSGTCSLFDCSDGTKTNTCDLMCKVKPESTEGAKDLSGFVETDEPKITGFYPTMGNEGTLVKVFLTKGQKNFSGPDVVELGGVPLVMKSFSNVPGSKADFIYEFALPSNAKTGKFAIKKPATFKNTAYSEGEFLVIPKQDGPYISEIKPMAGYAGQEVAVEFFMGTKKFSGLDSVSIGGVSATITSMSDVFAKKPNAYLIKFKIPETAKTGKIALSKKIFGSVSSANDFIVVPAQDAPTILSFTPTGAKVGESVVIKAVMGKKAFSGLDSIFIGETKAEIVSQFADNSGIRTFTIKVPENAKTGKIILRKPSAFVDVASATDFQVYGPVKSLMQKAVNFFISK